MKEKEMAGKEKKKLQKKLVITLLYLLICVIALVALTLTRYVTDTISGETNYEPAMFNTVLLGALINDDVAKLEDDSKTQSGADRVFATIQNGGTVQQTVKGSKITANLAVDQEPFGTSGGAVKLGPGGTDATREVESIYFTVTNGTTFEDPTETNSWKLKNVAESDIFYTLHILTDNNLPLTYKLYGLETVNDTTTGKHKSDNAIEYTLTDTITKEEGVVGTSDYIASDKNESASPVFYNGGRILKYNDDGGITVHRYRLDISWAGTGSRTINGQTVNDNDKSYMKELENIQILVEVESYVRYVDLGEKTGDVDTVAKGILIPELGEYALESGYRLSGTIGTLKAEKVVNYHSFTSVDTSETANFGFTPKSYTYNYDFYVCNGDSVSAQWTSDTANTTLAQDEKTGTSATRGENGKSDNNGHYTYSGAFRSGSYHLALAVPNNVGNDSRTDRSYETKYYIYNNGTWYQAQQISDSDAQAITLQSQNGRIDDTETTNVAEDWSDVYTMYQFVKTTAPSTELTVSTTSDGFESEGMTLYMTSSKENTGSMEEDDFRLFLYTD